MNVLYNTSIADPFVKVAQKLQNENNYNPVYWIGFNYDHSEELVPQAFPNCVYQSYRDAWRGIFNKEVENKASQSYLDIDFLNEFSRYELQAIKMMDRMDFDRYSFNYMERVRHFHRLIKSWLAVIELYKPELVVSAVNPHRIYDYVLYLLCQKKDIPFVIFQYSICVGWTWSNMNVYSVGDKFEKDYQRYLNQGGLTKDDLPADIKNKYEIVTKDYSVAVPYYVKMNQDQSRQQSNLLKLFLLYLKKYKWFGKGGVLSKGILPSLMRKSRNHSLEEGNKGIFDSIYQKTKQVRDCGKMRRFYSSLTEVPDLNKNYILLPLHYQPEATSSPAGDMFVDQTLCVETLLKNTPEDYMIYVKEHKPQFMPQLLGMTNRIKEFYTDMLKNERVKLLPLDMDTYTLMNNSKAVATVAGTVGWEAVMHKIPVIIFGFVWYEKMPGVLRITDSASASKIMDFIRSYSFNEQYVLAYLKAFVDNSFLAYKYKGEKERTDIDEDTCVNNLVNEILKCVNDWENRKV